MEPREMFIEGLLMPIHSGNCYKRVNRITRLAADVVASVSYGFTDTTVMVEVCKRHYVFNSLRRAESFLRRRKRQRLMKAAGGSNER